MIRVEVEEYCQFCLDFEPEASLPDLLYSSDREEPIIIGDTVVRCKYRERCHNIERYVKQTMKKRENT